MLVVGLLRHSLADDQLQVIHRDLHVVRLDEAIRSLHDAGLGIGEVVLGFRIRLRRLDRLALGRGFILRARLQCSFRVANPLQPTLASLQFCRQLVAAPIGPVLRVFGGICRFGLREQLRHFVPELLLLVTHSPVTHRLVLGRVRLDLAPVERHTTDPRRAQFARQAQHLLEEAFQRRQVRLAKIGDGAKIRFVAGCQHPERDVLEQPTLIFRDEKTPTQ
jgi:hypothetical protein